METKIKVTNKGDGIKLNCPKHGTA